MNFFISATGNDGNDGSSGAPWRTIGRVNSNVQAPGDVYSFRGGDTFTDATLTASSNGVTFNSYGTGTATISLIAKPGFSATNLSDLTVANLNVVGSGGTNQAGIDCEYTSGISNNLTLSGLTVSGFASDGIRVNALSAGTINQITIQDCTTFNNTLADNTNNNGTSGINVQGVFGASLSGVYTVTNVLVQRCVSHNNPGVVTGPNWTGSGIFLGSVSGGLITECVAHNNSFIGGGAVGIWEGDCKNVTIQFCESYNNRSSVGDGDGFDLEAGSIGCIVQFCYSHNNFGHGFLVESGELPSSNNFCRFNISENDAQAGIFDQAGIKLAVNGTYPNLNVICHNNTVFGSTPTLFCSCLEFSSSGAALTGIVANNIFYSGGHNMQLTSNGSFGGTQLQFVGNCYFATGAFAIEYPTGNLYSSLAAFQAGTGQEKIAGKPVGLQADPGLIYPGHGGTLNVSVPVSLAPLVAYKIRRQSATYRAGLDLTQFSIDPGQLDFYGNSISDPHLSIGAHSPFRLTTTHFGGTPYITEDRLFGYIESGTRGSNKETYYHETAD